MIVLRQGPRISVFAGTVFGIVQLFLGGYGLTLAHVMLDYSVAYPCLGLAGFFEKSPIVGVAASLMARFLAYFVSGVVFFGEYAPPELGTYVYSAVYNGSYMLPEFVISAVLIYLLIQRGILEYSI